MREWSNSYNGDDHFLHQSERWDLVGLQMLEEEGPQSGEQTMKPPPRDLRLDIGELESAFEYPATADPDYDDE